MALSAVNEGDEEERKPTAEMLNAWSLPTVIVNRFIVNASSHGVRVSFGEQVVPTKATNMHLAVYMSLADAEELSGLLSDLVRRINSAERSEDENADA